MSLVGTLGWSVPAAAVPPLVSGDVPTADYKHFEWYVGALTKVKAGGNTIQLPWMELVYGLTSFQEVTIEGPLVWDNPDGEPSEQGLGDIVVGTKFKLLSETEWRPQGGFSFEVKLPTGDEDRGLGSGATDYDLRLRLQKAFGKFEGILNGGRIWVGEAGKQDVWYYTVALEQHWSSKVLLLGEIFGATPDDPGDADQIAFNLGFKWKLRPTFTFLFSVGTAFANRDEAGPRLRSFVGYKWDF